MTETLKIRRSSAIKLLQAANCPNSPTYTTVRLKSKLFQLPDLIGDGDAAGITDVSVKKLLQLVVSSVTRGWRVEIVEG